MIVESATGTPYSVAPTSRGFRVLVDLDADEWTTETADSTGRAQSEQRLDCTIDERRKQIGVTLVFEQNTTARSSWSRSRSTNVTYQTKPESTGPMAVARQWLASMVEPLGYTLVRPRWPERLAFAIAAFVILIVLVVVWLAF